MEEGRLGVGISGAIPPMQVPDDVLLTATQFSGVAAFIEVLDVDALATLPDQLKTRLTAALESGKAR